MGSAKVRHEAEDFRARRPNVQDPIRREDDGQEQQEFDGVEGHGSKDSNRFYSKNFKSSIRQGGPSMEGTQLLAEPF